MNELRSEVIKILKRELKLYHKILSVHQHLENDLRIGSLEKAQIIFALEQRFNIFSNSNISEILTVGDCVKYVEQELKETG